MSTCVCHALEPAECVCGAWDDVDYVEWYNEEDIEGEYSTTEEEEDVDDESFV